MIDLLPYIAGTEERQSLKRNKSEHEKGISEKIKSGFNGESALQDESCSSGEKSTDIETDENFGKRSESSNRIEYGKNQEKRDDKALQNAKRKLKQSIQRCDKTFSAEKSGKKGFAFESENPYDPAHPSSALGHRF